MNRDHQPPTLDYARRRRGPSVDRIEAQEAAGRGWRLGLLGVLLAGTATSCAMLDARGSGAAAVVVAVVTLGAVGFSAAGLVLLGRAAVLWLRDAG